MFPSSTGVPVAPLQFVMAGRPLAAVAARFVLATETFAGLAALWFTVGFLSPACLGFLTFPAGAAVDVPGLATSGTVAAPARGTACALPDGASGAVVVDSTPRLSGALLPPAAAAKSCSERPPHPAAMSEIATAAAAIRTTRRGRPPLVGVRALVMVAEPPGVGLD